MTTCDICQRAENLPAKFFIPQAKVNLHSRDKTVQSWTGDICESCFQAIAAKLANDLPLIVSEMRCARLQADNA